MITAEDIKQKRDNLSQKATANQRAAADPKLSVWVNASAGTGKTKVLSDRVLRLLLAGIKAGKLLCLTYTKAAAVEMSSRVSKKLSEWAVAGEKELEEELIKLYGQLPSDYNEAQKLKAQARRLFAVLLDTPGGIKIQTLHSFYQEILKRFPIEAGISPRFEVMDQRTTKEAIEQIKSNLIAEINLRPDSPAAEAMNFLTTHVSEKKFPDVINGLINERGKLFRTFNRYQTKDNLLKAQAARLGVDLSFDDQQLIDNFFADMPRDDLRIMLKAWLIGGSRVADRAATLCRFLEDEYLKDFNLYKSIYFSGDKPYETYGNKDCLKAYPQTETIFKDERERVFELIEKQKSRRVYLSTQAVVTLADELLKGYEKYKTDRSLMDFNDMVLLTYRLLANPEVAKWVLFKLDGGIDSILIDEAQDTSPDQWDIIRFVSDEFFSDEDSRKTIFAVGDRKQSIYSFQGADPDKFDEMRQYFEAKTPKFKQVDMQVSFRSTAAVLDSVNQVFSDQTIQSGVITAGENVTHIPFRQGEGGRVELWELIEPEKDENKEEWLPPMEHENPPSTANRMAKTIAGEIKKAVTEKRFLDSQKRPVRYGDFLILVRSRDNFCIELIRECKKAGVKVSGMDRIHLLEQIAVQDLISLGKFLLLPEDDLSLAEALKSPLFGLTDDDLFKLCYQRKSSLWKSLEQCSDYAETTKILKQLLNMADYVRPFELYSEILNVENGRRKFAERMGSEAEDGLDEFLNLCLSFEQNHIASLQKFIEWFESDDVEIKREAENGNSDMVRLMTVHGSKGLQAPIVILPDTTRVPQNKRDAKILWDRDELFFYPSAAADYETICNRLIEKDKQKTFEEYKRLMYVALTRAEDSMIVCGFRKKNQPPENCWYNMFRQHFTKISTFDENKKVYHYDSAQIIDVKEKKKQEKTETPFKVEAWLLNSAQAENPLAKPLTPSKPEETEPAVISPLKTVDNSKLYRRGTIIHRLLQFLPDTAVQKREENAIAFIDHIAPQTDLNEKQIIVKEVLTLLNNPQFGSVFGPQSKAEVPIMGLVGEQIISGQIDRLIVEKDRVLIVDFKTNRPAAKTPKDVPEIYRRQLAAYRALLKQIYPDKNIISLILWTNTANLMEIE